MRREVLVLLLFLPVLAAAAFPQVAVVKVNVSERGEAFFQHLLVMDSRPNGPIEISVLGDKMLRVYDSQGELAFEIQAGKVVVEPRLHVENYSVTVEYFSDNYTSKAGENWDFSLSVPEQYMEAKFELALPQSTRILSSSPQGIFFIEQNMVKLQWDLKAAGSQTTALNAKYTFAQTPPGSIGSDYLLVFAVIVVLGLAGGVYYFFYMKKTKVQNEIKATKKSMEKNETNDIPALNGLEKGFSEKQKAIIKVLSENESRIVEELFKENPLNQRTLLVRTGLPKSTLSRTIKKLELKGIAKSLEIGNSNKIELTKEFLEKRENSG